MMLTTPAGSSAASIASARIRLDVGASHAGFATTVQPAASAGDTFIVTAAIAPFHGAIAPTTPTGSRRSTPDPSPHWRPLSKPVRSASSASRRQKCEVIVELTSAIANGMPTSDTNVAPAQAGARRGYGYLA